jgi:hypothetical protein
VIDPLCLRYGRELRHQIVVIEPFFEEFNRTRRLLNQVARRLLALDIGVTFVTLPGCGEGLTDISTVRLKDWRGAVADIASDIQPTVIASLRGGALIDDAGQARGYWRFSPETGARIVRDLTRSRLTSTGTTLYAGHPVSDAFLEELGAASPANISPVRIVRLATDDQAADMHVDASPLWRRAEPGEDDALTQLVAEDLSAWVIQCAAS